MSHQTHQPSVLDRATSSESATTRTSGRRRLARLAKMATIGTVVAALGGGLLAQPTSAARLSSSGTIGYVGLPTGECTTYPAWNRLDVALATPTIYAPNVRAGAGNDSAWVRYQVYVIDGNRNLVRSSTASSWVAAYDNRAASFTGSKLTFTNIPNYSTVWIYVEWYGYGSATYQLDTYQLYVKGLTYPYGPASSCAKYVPPGYIG